MKHKRWVATMVPMMLFFACSEERPGGGTQDAAADLAGDTAADHALDAREAADAPTGGDARSELGQADGGTLGPCSGPPSISYIAPVLGGPCTALSVSGQNLRCAGVVFYFAGAPQPALDLTYTNGHPDVFLSCLAGVVEEDCVAAAVPVDAPAGPVKVSVTNAHGSYEYPTDFYVIRDPALDATSCPTEGHEF